MCLGIPGKIETIEEGALPRGDVSFGGINKSVCLAFVPEARVGDYVIVHAGFAITQIDEQQAKRVFSYLEELAQPPTGGDS